MTYPPNHRRRTYSAILRPQTAQQQPAHLVLLPYGIGVRSAMHRAWIQPVSGRKSRTTRLLRCPCPPRLARFGVAGGSSGL